MLPLSTNAACVEQNCEIKNSDVDHPAVEQEDSQLEANEIVLQMNMPSLHSLFARELLDM